MPDLIHSSKLEYRFPEPQNFAARLGKGVVTFGARKAEESLPFLMRIVEQ